VDIDRRHRWIRGDWQITQWLLPRVPGSDARRIANPLSVLSQWKIFDNLRRSLVPVALLLLMLGVGCSCPNWRPGIAAGRFDHHASRIVGGVGRCVSQAG
jgi:cyclic beta-1,2-glucan synthetase